MEEKPSAGIRPHLDKLTLGVTRILGERSGERGVVRVGSGKRFFSGGWWAVGKAGCKEECVSASRQPSGGLWARGGSSVQRGEFGLLRQNLLRCHQTAYRMLALGLLSGIDLWLEKQAFAPSLEYGSLASSNLQSVFLGILKPTVAGVII